MKEKGNSLIKFDPEAGVSAETSSALDRTKIPGTLDYVLGKDVALQAFLNFSPLRNLDKAVGGNHDTAVMAFGSAISKYGVPDIYAKLLPGTELPDESSLVENLQECTLSNSPKGEEEVQDRSGEKSIKETVTLEELGEFVDKKRLIPQDLGVLMRHYNKQAEKAAALSHKKEGKSTKDVALEAAISEKTDLWPMVGEPDWAGFVNWVKSCEAADKKFRKTVYMWHTARQAREKEMLKKLESWTPVTVPSDASAGYGQPTEFYKGQPIALVDMKKLGLKAHGAGKK